MIHVDGREQKQFNHGHLLQAVHSDFISDQLCTSYYRIPKPAENLNDFLFAVEGLILALLHMTKACCLRWHMTSKSENNSDGQQIEGDIWSISKRLFPCTLDGRIPRWHANRKGRLGKTDAMAENRK